MGTGVDVVAEGAVVVIEAIEVADVVEGAEVRTDYTDSCELQEHMLNSI